MPVSAYIYIIFVDIYCCIKLFLNAYKCYIYGGNVELPILLYLFLILKSLFVISTVGTRVKCGY